MKHEPLDTEIKAGFAFLLVPSIISEFFNVVFLFSLPESMTLASVLKISSKGVRSWRSL